MVDLTPKRSKIDDLKTMKCSNCSKETSYRANFCPNCGASLND